MTDKDGRQSGGTTVVEADREGDPGYDGNGCKDNAGKGGRVAHLDPDVADENVVDDDQNKVAGKNNTEEDKVLKEDGHHGELVKEKDEEKEKDVAKLAPMSRVVDLLLSNVLVPLGRLGANVQLLVIGKLKDVAEQCQTE